MLRTLLLALATTMALNSKVCAGIPELQLKDRPDGSREPVRVAAHRGASTSAPENTHASITGAIDAKADLIEFDVRVTTDRKLLVFHDNDLETLRYHHSSDRKLPQRRLRGRRLDCQRRAAHESARRVRGRHHHHRQARRSQGGAEQTMISRARQLMVCGIILAIASVSVPSLVRAQSNATPEVIGKALPTAVAGDVLIIANGTYRDQVLQWRGKGSSEKPITVRAETPGGVVISGRSSLLIEGEHLVVEGLLFTDGHAPKQNAIELRGSHCTLRNTVVDSFNPPPDDSDREEKWVNLYGSHHRVEHCTFHNKTSASVTLTVWRETEKSDHHIIVANHFRGRPKGVRSNGYETIRIGTSDDSSGASHSVIEANLFEACDGEMETISVKCGANIVRGNCFVECAGTVTLRHGNDNEVSGNVFAGKLKKDTGGIRIYGSNHRITENVIIGTTGRGIGAIALMCGTHDPAANGYHAAKDVVIQRNLLVANQGPAFEFAAQFDADDRAVLPQNILVDANSLSSDDQASLVSGLDQPGVGVTWARNQVFLNNQVPREFTQNRPGLISSERVGAAWFRNRMR